jgi:hypothetical protein
VIAATLAVTVLVSAGCSGSDDAGEQGSDPCAVLTTADLEQATGVVWTQQPAADPAEPACRWTSATPSGLVQVFLTGTDGSSFEENRQSIRVGDAEPSDAEVEGADEAFATPDGSLVGMRVGDRYVQVTYASAATEPPAGAVTTALAAIAAGRV